MEHPSNTNEYPSNKRWFTHLRNNSAHDVTGHHFTRFIGDGTLLKTGALFVVVIIVLMLASSRSESERNGQQETVNFVLLLYRWRMDGTEVTWGSGDWIFWPRSLKARASQKDPQEKTFLFFDIIKRNMVCFVKRKLVI